MNTENFLRFTYFSLEKRRNTKTEKRQYGETPDTELRYGPTRLCTESPNRYHVGMATKRIVFTALFAALTAACGFISIPVPGTPLPIVLQNMMVVLDGMLLGPVWGAASVVLFILTGIIGLPVFSGGTAGIARIMGPTGGFIIGYAIAALAAGLIARRPVIGKKTAVVRLTVAALCGFAVMYIPGVLHFMRTMDKTFSETMALCVLPYLPGDAVKLVLSVLTAVPLRKSVARFVFNDDAIGPEGETT